MSVQEKTYYVGVDCGGTKIAFGLFDQDFNILAKSKIATPIELAARELLKLIADNCLALIADNHLSKNQIVGVGVGFPSFISKLDGSIVITSTIPCLTDVKARDILFEFLQIRVEIGNDAHCAALAEHKFGAGRGFDNMLYCPISTGIMSAIIMDGKLRLGSYGAAGETGHAIITPNEGVQCGCGNMGCYMSYISGNGIVKHIKKWIAAGEKTIMTELVNNNLALLDGKILKDAYDQADPLAIKAVKQMSYYLGLWLFNLYVGFNINCFVFGGGLLNFGDALFEPAKEVFYSFLVAKQGDIYFKFAELKDDFGIIGACQLLFL